MKKIEKYLTFLPFSISIGAILIYLFYTLRIRFSKRVIVTPSLTSTLKIYLIIALISLLIGLIIIFIKKIINLVKEKPINSKIITENIDSNRPLKVKITNPIIDNGKIVGKLLNTNQDVEIYIDDKNDFNFKLDGIACKECGGLISKEAAICPHCGIMFDEEVLRILDKSEKRTPKKKVKKGVVIANMLLILLFIILIFLVSNLLINKGEENRNNVNKVVINEESI